MCEPNFLETENMPDTLILFKLNVESLKAKVLIKVAIQTEELNGKSWTGCEKITIFLVNTFLFLPI